jgi:hypothetical protein
VPRPTSWIQCTAVYRSRSACREFFSPDRVEAPERVLETATMEIGRSPPGAPLRSRQTPRTETGCSLLTTPTFVAVMRLMDVFECAISSLHRSDASGFPRPPCRLPRVLKNLFERRARSLLPYNQDRHPDETVRAAREVRTLEACCLRPPLLLTTPSGCRV